MKRYGVPLLVIVLSSLLMYVARAYVGINSTATSVLVAGVLFVFGIYLNTYRSKKGDTWIQKFIVMALFILLLLIQLGLINIPIINKFLSIIEANTMVYYMFYVYFGYIFF